ncbi:MAG: hypothetical protein ILO68_06250, partial [Clostridia bacterium]|nr:hypothetical protein [Clostridia bacterium]
RSGETVSEWLDALDLPGASLFEEDGTEANPEDRYRTGLELRLDGSRIGVTVLWGDMNGDGLVTAMDYVMSKRTVLGTYSPEDAYLLAGALGEDNVTLRSYVMIKRHVLNTYDLFAQ